MSIEVTDKFWLDDPNILIRLDRISEFFVSSDMSITEKLNAITRFSIYTSIILTLYYKNPKYLSLIIIIAFICIFVYKFSSHEKFDNKNDNKNDTVYSEQLINKKRSKPTLNNPFMNSNSIDFLDNPNKPPAENYSEKTQKALDIKNDIKNKFNYNLYNDVGDTFSTQNSFRQFYTVNNGDYIPDRNGEFKEFLFGNKRSIKENTYEGFKNLSDSPKNLRHIN